MVTQHTKGKQVRLKVTPNKLTPSQVELGSQLIIKLGLQGVVLKTNADVDTVANLLVTRKRHSNLQRAVEKLPTTVLPGIALGVQATENAVRGIENEFGLLTSSEVSGLLGSKSSRSYASELRKRGKILGLERLNSYVYPGFQFDKYNGTIKPVIEPLRELSEQLGRTDRGLIFWLCSASTYFGGDRPVDHIDEPDLLIDVAHNDWAVEW